MILEGLVTTVASDGSLHLAAMGPLVDDAERASGTIRRLLLRPFATSHTATNLQRAKAGVFQITDDVLLLARVVAGELGTMPASRPADAVPGRVLCEACRAWEFVIDRVDDSRERYEMEARVVAEHAGRPFLGFHRAAHAVVEAAILFSRRHLLGADDLTRQFGALQPLVEKTGGPREREAFSLLSRRLIGG